MLPEKENCCKIVRAFGELLNGNERMVGELGELKKPIS